MIRSESGQILLFTIFALMVVLFSVLFLITGSQIYYLNSTNATESEKVIALAESGIDKAIAAINSPGSNYSGESETLLGDGSFSVTVTNMGNSNKIIAATGYIPNKQTPKLKKTIKTQLTNGVGVSFNYGMQIGAGGLVLLNGGTINGSLYSNGNISFNNNTIVTGDIYVAGGTEALADQQTDCIELNCTDFIFGKNVSGSDRISVAQSFIPNIISSTPINKVSMKLRKFGSPPNLTVRIMHDNNGKPDKNNILATGTLSASNVPANAIYDFYTVTFQISPNLNQNTTYWLMLDANSLSSTNYWMWQSDSAQSYTRGVAKYSSNWNSGNPTWNSINGDLSFKTFMGGVITSVISSGAATVSGDVHANTISGLDIQKDAYYQTISNSTVAGQSYPDSLDPSPVEFPVTDANISQWKDLSLQEGLIEGDVTVSNCNSPLGPGKIAGNLIFSNFSCTLSVKSPLWVTGNVSASGDVNMKLDESNGSNPGYMIVDGTIVFNNKTKLAGSGSEGGYWMLLSTYDSRATGLDAISVKNTFDADIVYAPNGYIDLLNKAIFKELNGYKITFHNNATLNYQTGLTNVVFTSGPSGSFSVVKGTYQVN